MKLMQYLFRRFIPLFLGALMFFAMVLVLVDLLMNLWNYISNQVPGATVGRILLMYIPKCVWYATPLAILFAVSYTLSDFYANNELVAVFASGVPLIRFTAPLLVLSFLLSIGLFFFDDRLVVPTYAIKTSLQEKSLNKEKSLNNDRIVVISDEGNIVYKADYYDDSSKRLYTVIIIVRNEDKTLAAIIRADSAVFQNDHWNLSGGTQYSFKDGTMTQGNPDREIIVRLTEEPTTFQNNTVSVETVSAREAKQYIEHLQKAGLPFSEELSLYYKKFAFPFVLFIVVFLSIGLSGKTRKNVLLVSLAACISAAVLFYVSQMITMLLAKFQYITPFMGAWFPVFLFVAISIVLLKYART
ncbi:MAG: LptF/LptG family permease [Treponema sp.]|nr:LptF/LptG family permease [Treponema sp.]